MSVRPLQASADDGFGIIEVIVSALVVVLVSLGVFAALDAAGRTADTNKSRSAASALAQADQDRMRSVTISNLTANADTTRTATVDGESYTVRSQASYVIDPADAAVTDCSSSEHSPRYLKLVTTVSWPKMRGTSPVEETSLRAIPTGSVVGLGSLAIGILDRSGAGVANVPVSISGPQSSNAMTNANGCVIFGYVKKGTYTLSFSKPDYVEATYPNRTNVTDSVVVAEDSLASKSYQYDLAGAARVAFETTTGSATATTVGPTPGDLFTVENALLGSVSTRTFGTLGVTGTTANTGNVLFPFTSSYKIWSGGCLENKPPSTVKMVTIPRGSSSVVVALREPRLRLTVFAKTQTGSRVLATAAKVVFSPSTSGCTSRTTATQVSSSTGLPATNTGVFDAPLPYGPYSVCIQNKVTNPTATVTASGLNNSNDTLRPYTTNGTNPSIPDLPYRAASAPTVTPCPT